MSSKNTNQQQNYGSFGHSQDECNSARNSFSSGVADYNGVASNNNNDEDSDSDDNKHTIIDVQFLDDLNCSLLTQIREQSATGRDADARGPYKSQFQQIARSRRRPMIRTKSESDFQMLMDDDIREMRVKLLRSHQNRHHHKSTFNLKKVTKFTRQQKFVLASIALVDFTSFCAMSILAPFFPSEASKKGMPGWVSGFVFSVYALCVFIASPFMGKAVNFVGPKFLLIVGVFLGGCCNILFGVLDKVESLELFTTYCFLVRIFEALGAAAFATSSYTFVAKLFPDNIGTVLGVLETFVGLGMSFGPAIGGFLFDFGGYGLPFFALGTLMLLTIPLNMYLLPSNDDDEFDPEPSESMWKLFRLPPIVILSLVIIVASNTWSFLDPTLEPHLREFNLSAKQLGLFFLVASVLYAISSPFWGFLADRVERTWILMVIGLAVSSVGLILLGPSPLTGLENSIWLNTVALIILGASISLTLLPTFEAMLDIAIDAGYGDETRTYGLIGGLWSSMYSLGEVTGPSVGAFIMDHFGFPICSTFMAGVCLILAIIVFFYFQSCHDESSSMTDSAISSKQGNGDKLRSSDIYDSGISDKSASSSVSVHIIQNGVSQIYSSNYKNDSRKEIVNERTRLLGPQNWPNGKTFGEVSSRNTDEVSSNLSRSSSGSESSLHVNSELEASYPDVLRTIGITAFGAIEI